MRSGSSRRRSDTSARAVARAADLLAGESYSSAAQALRLRARELARRAAGTGGVEHLPSAVAELEARVAQLRFEALEQSERTARLQAVSEDLVAVLGDERHRMPEVPGAVAPAAPMRVVTVIVPALLPHARVLAQTLGEHQPDWELETVVVGKASDEGVTPVGELLELDSERLLVEHPWAELLALLVPRVLLARVRDRPGPIVHLPATTKVLRPLGQVATVLRDHAVLLAPRVAVLPPSDGLEPSPARLDQSGHVDPHLIGIDGSAEAITFLRWWVGRLELVTGEPGAGPGHRRVDRHEILRSLELATARPGVGTLREAASRLTAYNALEQPLEQGPNGLQAGGRPVAMIDFGEFDPSRPFRLDGWSSRVALSRLPALAAEAQALAADLLQAGWSDVLHSRDVGRTLPAGPTFDADLHSLYSIAHALGAAPADPFQSDGAAAFMGWLRGPAARGGAHGINRVLQYLVARHRRDVALTFADLDGPDGEALVAWALRQGGEELKIPRWLLPEPAPVHSSLAEREPPAARTGPPRVRVSGYMGHVLGLGAAARGYAEALAANGVGVATRSVSLDRLRPPVALEEDYGAHHAASTVSAETTAADAELICVNPGELEAFVHSIGPEQLGHPRIGVWGWETDTVPPNWGPAYELVDEVWVYSRFVADNVSALTTLPVVALPPPVPVPAAAGELRLGVPDGFLFLFVFDYSSTIQRKNPVGLIEAFTRAFAAGEGPRLLVKTLNAPLLPLAHEEVLWAARDHPDIHVVDRSLSDAERDALIATCDCYVSLHRSEGFGLTMAEAMAIGKPVIATGYSGNVDFMTSDNSLLVDYELTRVGPDAQIYPADGTWAQPSVAHAAQLMRAVYEDPSAAGRLGARARADIARTLTPEATGAAMRRRLEHVLAGSARGT